jgi:hypothetical protein
LRMLLELSKLCFSFQSIHLWLFQLGPRVQHIVSTNQPSSYQHQPSVTTSSSMVAAPRQSLIVSSHPQQQHRLSHPRMMPPQPNVHYVVLNPGKLLIFIICNIYRVTGSVINDWVAFLCWLRSLFSYLDSFDCGQCVLVYSCSVPVSISFALALLSSWSHFHCTCFICRTHSAWRLNKLIVEHTWFISTFSHIITSFFSTQS